MTKPLSVISQPADSKIKELQEFHKQRLTVKFDDTNEDQQDSHIERAATAITAIFRRAEKKLKAISADTDFCIHSEPKVAPVAVDS